MHTKKQRLMYIDASLYINPFSSGVPKTLQWVVSLMKTAVCFAASSQLWLGVGDEKHFNFNQWERRLSNKWPIGCRIDSLSILSRNIFDNSIIFGFLNMSVSPFRYCLSGEPNRAMAAHPPWHPHIIKCLTDIDCRLLNNQSFQCCKNSFNYQIQQTRSQWYNLPMVFKKSWNLLQVWWKC